VTAYWLAAGDPVGFFAASRFIFVIQKKYSPAGAGLRRMPGLMDE
jgi:hypothetical protein